MTTKFLIPVMDEPFRHDSTFIVYPEDDKWVASRNGFPLGAYCDTEKEAIELIKRLTEKELNSMIEELEGQLKRARASKKIFDKEGIMGFVKSKEA